MEDKSELISQQFPLRIDKNITKNILSFNEYIEDNPLIFFVMLHIAKTYQRNFWNFGTFEPGTFAKEWKFTKNYLRSTAPDPYHYHVLTKGLNTEESEIKIESLKKLEKENADDASYRLWDSLLEDALYRLANLNIQLRSGGIAYKTEEENLNYDMIGSERVLKRVTALYKKSTQGSSKVLYEYEVDSDFLINLSKLYIKADKEVIYQLKGTKSKNLDTFYIYLLNLRDDMEAKQSNIATPFFHILSELLNLDKIKEPRNRKTKITQKINKIREAVPGLIEDFTWIKENKNSKYSYQPKITFYSKFKSVALKREYNTFERNQKFNVILSNELKNVFDRLYSRPSRTKDKFLTFLSNPKFEQDRDTALRYTSIILNGSSNYSSKDKEMYEEFIKRMTARESIYHISKIFK